MSECFQPAQQAEEGALPEALLVEGLAGGEDIPLTREFWTQLKIEARHIAAKHKPPRSADAEKKRRY